MSERRNFDILAPEFHLKINDRDIPNDARADLIAVSVLEDVDAPGMFSFTLKGWDAARMEVKWLDDRLFREGNPVEIQIGYRDRAEPVFWGEVTGLEPEFPEGGAPVLTVRGYDRRHRLMRERTSHSFLDMTDAEIAQQIAQEAGLSADVEDAGLRNAYVLRHNQTALEFLEERADLIGYEVVVIDRTLHFRPRRSSDDDVITLRREIELLEFFPRLSTMGQAPRVKVRGWSPGAKEEIVAEAGPGDEGDLMEGSVSGPACAGSAFGEVDDVRVDRPVLSQDEADRAARGHFEEMALQYIRGSGLCIGSPDLRAGRLVRIEGLGERFSGVYYVTSTEHAYRPGTGYRTAFSVQRNAA
jgi:phage protein D